MVRSSALSATPLASAGRSERAANSAARAATVSAKRERGTSSSISRQSIARLPRMPSNVVQKKSAWSWRTMRLSTSRVSPPVPGRTASSGNSGSETVEEPSSISMM